MSSKTDMDRPIDLDILPADTFNSPAYRKAALAVTNRIRQRLGLSEADRFLAGYRGDPRYGNPVAFTIGAGVPTIVAHYDQDNNQVVVDTLAGERVFPLIRGSVIPEFINRFELGHYPDLESRKGEDE